MFTPEDDISSFHPHKAFPFIRIPVPHPSARSFPFIPINAQVPLAEPEQRHSQRLWKQVYKPKRKRKEVILFVRETKTDGFGNTNPFYCFGFVDFIAYSGEKPMSIEWEVKTPIMPKFLEAI